MLRLDARKLDEHDEGRRVVRPETVGVRPEAAARATREREDLPEVGKELLDLVGSGFEVASLFHRANGTQAGQG